MGRGDQGSICRPRDEVAVKMKSAQRAEAQRMASEWVSKK
jgi:hypothetical protein